jgi:hypothetical protein
VNSPASALRWKTGTAGCRVQQLSSTRCTATLAML